MDEEIKTEAQVVIPVVTEEKPTVIVEEQDPLKTELEKVQRKGRTKADKLIYSRDRINEQLKEMGIDEEEPDDEDEKPVTVGMLKKIQAETATKTALDLANEITNDTERELAKYHLENTIRSTGNAQEDLRLAKSLVNSAKNSQIIEETIRKPQANNHGTGGGAPATTQKSEELTPEELSFMRPPFNLSKEQVIAARSK